MTMFHGPDIDPPGQADCPNCGTTMPGTAAHCDACGNSLIGTADPGARDPGDGLYCPYCAAPNRAGAAYCATCGNRLFGGVSGKQVAPLNDPQPKTSTSVSSSGRHPVFDSSPQGRADFLADASRRNLDPYDGESVSLFSRMEQAERAVEAAEAHRENTRSVLQMAAMNAPAGCADVWDPETTRMRAAWRSPVDLPLPEQESYGQYLRARIEDDEAQHALTAALSLRNTLLSVYDRSWGDTGTAPISDDGFYRFR
jgi:hypothetical protein